MLGNIWKTHDSSLWQNNFINGIQIYNQSPWFKPMTIHSSKAQFSLATSKPDFHWHYFIKKKRAQDYQTLGKEKNMSCYRGKEKNMSCYRSKKRIMAIILWRNSLRAILRTMFSYYKPMKYMNIICNIEFIKVNIIYKNILKLVLLFQTIQLIAQRPITSIYEKPKNIY